MESTKVELDATHRIPDWARTRQQIKAAIEERAWSDNAQAYTQAFGTELLDASVLMMPLVGFTPATSPRMRSTVYAIRDQLTGPGGLVYRYKATDDGLPGTEGAFLLCTFWLAQALAMAGDTAAAREVFDSAAGAANDVGLLAEEVDPLTGELLGNFPQAFSHIGLVNAAWTIFEAESSNAQDLWISFGASRQGAHLPE
jgi:GH15 family glucan-1,4-alpha-glucosidase